MATDLHLAKRYAQAFINTYVMHATDIRNIKEAIKFLKHNTTVFTLLKVPLLDAKIKIEALEKYLIKKFNLPSSFYNLMQLLINHHRSYFIIDVLEQIQQLHEIQEGIETFTITSPVELSYEELQTLQTFLAKNTQHTIEYNTHVDPHLIAGIRMQSDDHIWEYSIRKHLTQLKVSLVGKKDFYG